MNNIQNMDEIWKASVCLDFEPSHINIHKYKYYSFFHKSECMKFGDKQKNYK